MIETDLARIASALETLADAYCRQVDTTARFLSDDGGQVRQMTHEELGLANAQVVSEAQPEFVKPKAGPELAEKLAKHYGYAITEIQILYPERFTEPA